MTINPTPEELDALKAGSIALVLDNPDDKWPEAFLRYGSGWTQLEAGSDVNGIPSASLATGAGKTVVIAWDAAAGGGREVTTREELLALPEGTIVRGVRVRHNPVWPNVIRRVSSYPGNEFAAASPDLDDDPIPAGAAARYYGDLTVIWVPGGKLPGPPPLDLARLKALAEAVPERRWMVWENTHGDPVVVETGGQGTFKEICRVSTRFSDYGRNVNAFIAAMDPETVLALIELAAGSAPCRCGDMLRDTAIQCPAHPDVRPRTVRERIDFEQAFDAALERSRNKPGKD